MWPTFFALIASFPPSLDFFQQLPSVCPVRPQYMHNHLISSPQLQMLSGFCLQHQLVLIPSVGFASTHRQVLTGLWPLFMHPFVVSPLVDIQELLQHNYLLDHICHLVFLQPLLQQVVAISLFVSPSFRTRLWNLVQYASWIVRP